MLTNHTLQLRLSKLVNEHKDIWDKFLEDVAFSITTQNQSSTKVNLIVNLTVYMTGKLFIYVELPCRCAVIKSLLLLLFSEY